MKNRFLEIHFNSSSGRIARTLKIKAIPLILISVSSFILILLLIFFSILYLSNNDISKQQIYNYIDNKIGADSSSISFINPIDDSHFYISKSIQKKHRGIDIAAKKGANVIASSIGKVLHRGFDNIYGKVILLSHKNNFYTFYGHLDTIFVNKHEFVNSGRVIGLVGETGQATAPHLHFEIWDNWDIKDPRLLIKELEERDVTE